MISADGSAGALSATPPNPVVEAMCRSGFHRGHPEVVVRETHTAWVLLAGDRAYKIKKPVRTAFLDFSTLERRRQVCAEEVSVNRPLAASLQMRVRAVVPHGDAYVLAGGDDPAAAEYVIEMRRFDEQRTMASLIEAGTLRDQQIDTLGRRLAAFHADAQVASPDDFFGDVKGAYDRNARELLALAGDGRARRALALDRFAGAFLLARRAEIAARAGAGCVRDGHGDLRAEHVVFEQSLAIVDRLEFDPRLRSIDVADDLAFLTMDLQRLGAGAAARRLVQVYRDAGGDPGSEALRSYYGAYRALVRAKVALLRARQLEDAAAAAAAAQADELLALAERLAWRARGPLVLAIGGPPASGKSTLAAALSRRGGWRLLSSDAVRKQAHGIAPDERAPDEDYTAAARAAVYRALGERARDVLSGGEGAIVDATFGDAGLRAAFLAGLGTERSSLRALECRASAAVRALRARGRRRADAHGSDAGPAVAARLGARHSGWDELPDEAILPLRSAVDVDLLVDQVADWLDIASVVCHAAARSGTDVSAPARPYRRDTANQESTMLTTVPLKSVPHLDKPVTEAMHHGVIMLPATSTLADAAAAMRDNHVHAVLISGTDGSPLGWVTSRGILHNHARDWTVQSSAADAITQPAASVAATATLADAMTVFVATGASHLLIDGPDGRPVGVIADSDLVAFVAP